MKGRQSPASQELRASPQISSASFRRIDRVNQLTESAESTANRCEDKPGQMGSFKFVLFFRNGSALDNFARAQDVSEMIVQIDKRLVR